VKQPPPRGL